MPSGGTIHIEDIQDQVELALMRAGEHKIARDYVIYREEQARKRAQKRALSAEAERAAGAISVLQPDGSRAPLNIERLQTVVSEACAELFDGSTILILFGSHKGGQEKESSSSFEVHCRILDG